MDAELAALASGGAATLVGLMVTDAWKGARERIVALWWRHRPAEAEAFENELDVLRAELSSAGASESGAAARNAAEDRVRRRLEALVDADPAATHELAALARELHDVIDDAATARTIQRVSAGRDAYVAGRDQTVNVQPKQ